MTTTHSKLLLIFDDREFTSGEVRRLVGVRRFGEITFKRRPLHEHFRDALPAWAKEGLVRLETGADLAALRSTLETSSEDTIACVIAGRSGFPRADLLTQLIERLPYAEEDFTEKLYKPLIVFWRNAHDQWINGQNLHPRQYTLGSNLGNTPSDYNPCNRSIWGISANSYRSVVARLQRDTLTKY